MKRRTLVRAIGATGALALAGCAEDSEPDAVLEYTLSVLRPDAVPASVSRNPEAVNWVGVQFELIEGSLDASALFTTRVRVRIGDPDEALNPDNVSFHLPIAVEITSPERTILTADSNDYTMHATAVGTVYFTITDQLQDPTWIYQSLAEDEYSAKVRKN